MGIAFNKSLHPLMQPYARWHLFFYSRVIWESHTILFSSKVVNIKWPCQLFVYRQWQSMNSGSFSFLHYRRYRNATKVVMYNWQLRFVFINNNITLLMQYNIVVCPTQLLFVISAMSSQICTLWLPIIFVEQHICVVLSRTS